MAKVSKEQARQPESRSQVFKEWILHHKIESTAVLVCFLGAIVILCLVFAGGSNEAPPATTQTPNNGGGDTSTTSGDSADNGGDNQVPPPAPTNADALVDSPIYQKLALLTDLQDTTSPQYKAADWLIALDFLKLSASSASLQQRFALATLYFATGGGLTSKQGWRRCSAVPPPTQNQETEAASNMQCVLRDGKFICAERENFETCQFIDEDGVVNQGKRFLSPVDECEWFGITCDDNGNVIMIDIESNELTGELPPEVSLLTELTRLNLSENAVGGVIPKELGLMNNVTELLLASNQFASDIPVEIYDLPLIKLELERNNLEGTLSSKLGIRDQLQVLYLNHNKLEGELPSELGQLVSLRKATFHQNDFSGPLPTELAQLGNLSSIKFANNDLSGSVPDGLCSLGIPISADCLADSSGVVRVSCYCCNRCCNEAGRCRDL